VIGPRARVQEIAVPPAPSTDALVLDRLFATAPVGLGFLDPQLRYQRVNEALAQINGRAVADHVGRTPTEILGELGGMVEPLLEQVLVTGEPILDAEVSPPDGRCFVVSYTPLAGHDGGRLGLLAVVREVTAGKRIELDLERALHHSTRIQEVTASLSAALTVGAVADVIVQAAMEVIGGTCGVLAVREDADLEVRHRFGMEERPPSAIPIAGDLPMPEAVRSRRPVTVRSRAEWCARYAQPPSSALEGFVAVPLLFEGEATGCMGIGLPHECSLDVRELSLLSAIARQGAQALDRARLYEEREYVAATLQRGLLPDELPAPGGFEVAVSHHPFGDGSQVGGDFYDVVDVGGGRWVAAVGDVCGKGAPAAVLSSVVRATINAVAHRDHRPADILAVANQAILRQARSRHEYATAVCAMLSTQPGGSVRAAVGSAGHPPAIVLRVDGELQVMAGEGVLLGATEDPGTQEVEVELAPGDALVLYTDGITDARVAGELFGEARLHAVLRAEAGRAAAEITGAVEAAVRDFQAGPPLDDAALLVLRAT
jgi:PAS domain S-box-containing protein